jgi:hypothetical protein
LKNNEKMDNSYLEYRQKVWQFLDNMKDEDCYEIDKLCVADNKEKFIACIKSYMDSKKWQGWLNFNHDYSKIYKIAAVTFKQETL